MACQLRSRIRARRPFSIARAAWTTTTSSWCSARRSCSPAWPWPRRAAAVPAAARTTRSCTRSITSSRTRVCTASWPASERCSPPTCRRIRGSWPSFARARPESSAAGVYLDRIGHYLTEAALPIGLGVRADGGWHSLGGWTTLGLVIAVMVLLIKTETVLVNVARAESGRAKAEDAPDVAAPRGGLLRRIRRAAGLVPFFRTFVAVEFSFLALAAAIADTAAGDETGSRVLVIALLPVGALPLVGHLV